MPDTASFLEDKLKILGLNETESADFITYWLPILAQSEYNWISFPSADYAQLVPLSCQPQPDTLIRVYDFAGAGRAASCPAAGADARTRTAVLRWLSGAATVGNIKVNVKQTKRPEQSGFFDALLRSILPCIAF